MGLINLGSIGKAFTQGLKSIAGPVLTQATGLLKNVAGDLFKTGFDQLGKLGQKFLQGMNLPSPFGGLAQKLLGKGMEQLKGLVGGMLEKALQKLTDLVQNKVLPGAQTPGQTVNTPGLSDRATAFPAEFQKMLDALKAAGFQVPTMPGAAAPAAPAAAAAPPPAAAAAPAAATTAGFAPYTGAQGTNAAGLPPALSNAFNAATTPGLSGTQQGLLAKAKAAGMDEKQIAQMEIQFQMENMKQLMEMFSNIAKTLAGMSQTLVGNVRA